MSGITPARRAFTAEVKARYLDRERDVAREGRVALVTAGPPGAGKSSAVDRLGWAGAGWRRLDADIIKTYLIEQAVNAGVYDDVLGMGLADGYPVMPGELAALVHTESVDLLEQIQRGCLARGENVVVEGTLSWPPAGAALLSELVARGYQDATIVDVEVSAAAAQEQAVDRAARPCCVRCRGGWAVHATLSDRAGLCPW